jgi:tetratricopeptide (TPR) repeat protein
MSIRDLTDGVKSKKYHQNSRGSCGMWGVYNMPEFQHSKLLFGRQVLTEKLYQFMSKQPLTVVLGASKTGKSSLVHKGLIPYLKQLQSKSNQQQWHILAIVCPSHKQNVENLAAQIKIWSQNNPQSKLLLVIDQLEELINLSGEKQEREKLIEFLAKIIAKYSDKLRIILILRSDFEFQFRNSVLEPYWNAARFVIPTMMWEKMHFYTEEAASEKMLYFQLCSLIENFIDEVAHMPGTLPLFSFTLTELYLKYLKSFTEARGNNRLITQENNEEMGGVLPSLVERADSEYEALIKQDKSYERIIRYVMLRTVAVSNGKLVRRRVLFLELEYPEPQNTQIKEVIRRFCAAGLLVTGRDIEGKPYLELTHDFLLQRWQKLLEWKQEHEESFILQRQLAPAAMEWKRQQKAKYLWNNNPRLDLLKQVLNSNDNWFNQIEVEFVRQSIVQKYKNSALRKSFTVGFSLLAIIALVVKRESPIAQTNTFRESNVSKSVSETHHLCENQPPSLTLPIPCPPVLIPNTTTVPKGQYRTIQPHSTISASSTPLPIVIEDFYTRGSEITERSNQEKVIKNYNQIISKNPRNATAYINRGIAYYRQGKYDQAITNYNQAISISKNVHAYINRGIAYHRQGKYELAIADYNRALGINKNNVDAYINRGITYRRLGYYEQALADYQQALSIDSNNPDAYYALGLTYAQLGNKQAAAESYRKAANLYQQKGKKNYHKSALMRIKELQQ